jgi:hypothetical protein
MYDLKILFKFGLFHIWKTFIVLSHPIQIYDFLDGDFNCKLEKGLKYLWKKIPYHYEKLHPSKPHYPATKTQKTIHIQLLCNYPLGITTIVQLPF